MARKRLGEILVEAGVLDEAKLRAALAEQRRWGGYLGRVLVDMKLVTEDIMVQALSRQLNFPVVNLDTRPIAQEVLDVVPADLAEQQSVIPFAIEGKFLDVAMADPTNLGIVDELRIRTRLNVRTYLAGPKMIERALARFYRRGAAAMTGTPVPGVLEDPRNIPGMQMIDLQEGAPTSTPSSTTSRRAMQAAFLEAAPRDEAGELAALQARVQHLESLVARDEDVLRKLLSVLVQKNVVSREEILERLR